MAGVLIGVILPAPAGQILPGELGPGFGHQFGVERGKRPKQQEGMPPVPYDLALGRTERRRLPRHEGVSPLRRSIDLHRVCWHAPAFGALQLHTFRHGGYAG